MRAKRLFAFCRWAAIEVHFMPKTDKIKPKNPQPIAPNIISLQATKISKSEICMQYNYIRTNYSSKIESIDEYQIF